MVGSGACLGDAASWWGRTVWVFGGIGEVMVASALVGIGWLTVLGEVGQIGQGHGRWSWVR